MTVSKPLKGKVTKEERAAYFRFMMAEDGLNWDDVLRAVRGLPTPDFVTDGMDSALWLAGYRAGEAELARLQAELAQLREERDMRTTAIIDLLWQHVWQRSYWMPMEESATRLIGLDCDWVYAHWDDRDFFEKVRALLAKLERTSEVCEQCGEPFRDGDKYPGEKGGVGICTDCHWGVPTTERRAPSPKQEPRQ